MRTHQIPASIEMLSQSIYRVRSARCCQKLEQTHICRNASKRDLTDLDETEKTLSITMPIINQMLFPGTTYVERHPHRSLERCFHRIRRFSQCILDLSATKFIRGVGQMFDEGDDGVYVIVYDLLRAAIRVLVRTVFHSLADVAV